MRVTNNMFINRMMDTLNTNMTRMSKYQDQLSTGKKISKASDDPIIAARAMKFRSDVSEIGQYQKNTDDAISWADMADSALGSLGDIVQRARELAVQASSDTNSAGEKTKIKDEVMQLFNQAVGIANTTYAGRHIFSGYKTDQSLILEKDPPGPLVYTNIPIITDATNTNFRMPHDRINGLPAPSIMASVNGAAPVAIPVVPGAPGLNQAQVDTTTGIVTFNVGGAPNKVTSATATYGLNRVAGDYNPNVYTYSNMTQTQPMEGEDIRFEIGIGDKINVNVVGNKVFGATSGATSTGSNIANFNNLINALATNNAAGIQQAISDLDTFLNDTLEQRADIGSRANRLELTKNRLGDDFTNFSDLMSKNEDADIAQVIMNLKNEENVYKASLEVGARIIQPTLVDFIR